jgi:hypothetical protein
MAWNETISDGYGDQHLLAERVRRSMLRLVDERVPGWSRSIRAQVEAPEGDGAGSGTACPLHPEFLHWHLRLAELLGGQASAQAVEGHLRELPSIRRSVLRSQQAARANRQRLGCAIDVGNRGTAYAGTLARVAGRAKEEKNMSPSGSLHEVDGTPFVARIAQAAALIESCWPEALRDIEHNVDVLVLFSGPGVQNFTDMRTHRAIYMNVNTIKSDVPPFARTAEILLHEAAHTRLNGYLAVHPLFRERDPLRRYVTPLRPDPRPLFGVVHQLFVLARLAHFYTRLEHRGGPSRISRRRDLVVSTHQCLDLLLTEADLTPAGEALVDAVRTDVDGLSFPRVENSGTGGRGR